MTQHIIKDLGSFSLSIHHPQCQLHPQAGSPVSMRRLSAAGKAIIASQGLLGEEESLAPYGPLKTVRNLFSQNTPSPLCLELILAQTQSEPPRNIDWIGPLKVFGYGSSQDIRSSFKHLDLTEVISGTDAGHALAR